MLSAKMRGQGTPALFELEVQSEELKCKQHGRRRGGGASAPLPGRGEVSTLSLGALRLREELRGGRKLSLFQAKVLVGQGAQAALSELVLKGEASFMPGGDGTRAGRAAGYVAAEPVPVPTELELCLVRAQLAGESGTLGGLSQKLGFPERVTLAVLQALVSRGEASGGAVGVTFAYRVYSL